MRARVWLAWVAVLASATVLVLGRSGGLAAPGAPSRAADASGKSAQTNVDVELVLAVDVSYSMDPDEQELQRDGYVSALTSHEFLDALRQGIHGRIAVTYVEWAGAADQKVLVPWRLIDGPQTAAAVADEIKRAPYRRAYRTSISGALSFSAPLFEGSPYRGIRRVIDVSGDGANNQGAPVTVVRDEVLAKGITINGLPILLKRALPGTMDMDNLDVYYEDCVTGGAGSFVVPIHERNQFKDATRTKLVLEVAGRQPEPRVVPASADAPRVSCTIGERMWQQRWGRDMDFK
ncbi:MAG TPA: DUF1194 domain-containing protein [Xanthobacteraceae bacterium]|nr:DUF1194 domain-containing protein [Xanthobacteraceae bacterium]